MTRVDGPWLRHRGTQAVLAALTARGYEALLVGGCVRNALLGEPIRDIDIATSATPEQTISSAKAAGLHSVPTGIDHGTITVVAHGQPHEVTTFRADVETDGRHAVVQFSTDVRTDAARRDFTMNALYADAKGRIVDPLNGIEDLQKRRLRFVGDAHQRIVEDHLRSLRYFRFFAWYGDPRQGPDPDALDAIARNLDGLERLSRERVGAEVTKLLQAPDPGPAVALMEQTGALARVLPGATGTALPVLVHLETAEGVAPDAVRRLACLGWRDGPALRLTKADSKRLMLLPELVGGPDGPVELGFRHGAGPAMDVLLLRAALLEQPLPSKAAAQIARGAAAICPVTARDLMPGLHGPALGARLRDIESRWLASDLSLTREDLLRP